MKSACVGILILILVICGAVKSRSTENLVASAAAAAEPKLPDRATKVKGGDEANRRLMALSEEDRRSVFLRILALAKEHCVEITRTFYQQPAKQWNVRCRGGPSYVIKVEAPNGAIESLMRLGAATYLPCYHGNNGEGTAFMNELDGSSELLLGQARLWCALRTRHASPTALEPPQLCIDLPRLLSSQCHLSSLSLHRSDCRFGDPARRTHRRLQR